MNAGPTHHASFVSLILVTCNSASDLPGLLESLRMHPPSAAWELIVVDNGSTDDSTEIIRQQIPEARIVTEPVNRGFAAAVNTAARLAVGEYLLLINPDVSWTGDPVTALVAEITQRPKAAAVVARLIHPDGSPQASLRRFPNHTNIWFSRGSVLSRVPLLGRLSKSYTIDYPPIPSAVEAAAATFMLIRSDAFDAVGGMDEGFFLYVEDTDLCKRWTDTGWEVWSCPTAVVTHSWSSRKRAHPHAARWHRDGIRRYFAKHFPHARVRNALVSAALGRRVGHAGSTEKDAANA